MLLLDDFLGLIHIALDKGFLDFVLATNIVMFLLLFYLIRLRVIKIVGGEESTLGHRTPVNPSIRVKLVLSLVRNVDIQLDLLVYFPHVLLSLLSLLIVFSRG